MVLQAHTNIASFEKGHMNAYKMFHFSACSNAIEIIVIWYSACSNVMKLFSMGTACDNTATHIITNLSVV